MSEILVTEENNFEKNQKPLPWATKNGFPDWLTAIIWLVIVFTLFQLIANVLAVVFIIIKEGMPADPTQLLGLITKNLRWVFVGNSIGQVTILALATIFISRIVVLKENRNNFFSFQKGNNLLYTSILSALLMILIQPTIWLMGYINLSIPFPESYLAFEDQQMQILIDFLKNEKSLLFILINVALVPAICEEILFRGFAFKLFSNSAGAVKAILISGFLFGIYHLKLTQLIPLSVIGMLLAWLTWKSGSLIPAIIAHFVNNGGSVIAAYFYPEYAFGLGDEFLPPIWITVLSLILTITTLILFQRISHKGGTNVFRTETE